MTNFLLGSAVSFALGGILGFKFGVYSTTMTLLRNPKLLMKLNIKSMERLHKIIKEETS